MTASLCYHEAGHAVMAVLLGGEVLQVTIEPDLDEGPRRDGDATIRWRHAGVSKHELLTNELLTVLAGPVAEMVYEGERKKLNARAEWSVDCLLAIQFVQQLASTHTAQQTLLAHMTERTWQLVSGNEFWQAVAEVADLLDAYETIEGELVAECVARWLE